MGSWVTYGLGSENQNLPGFVVMLDKTGGPISGPKNWSINARGSAKLPCASQKNEFSATSATARYMKRLRFMVI